MAVTSSPRLGITRWSASTDPFSRTQLDADHGKIDSLVAIDVTASTFASLPTAGKSGRYGWCTDTQYLYRDSGSAWVGPLNPKAGAAGQGSGSAPGDGAGPGSLSTVFARADHQHAREGWGTSATHATAGQGSVGSSGTVSDGAHVHQVDTSTPGGSSPGDQAATGTSVNLARADHRHLRETVTAGTTVGLPASPVRGQMVFVEDTQRLLRWDGLSWTLVLDGGPWREYTPIWGLSSGGTPPTMGTGAGKVYGRYQVVGKSVNIVLGLNWRGTDGGATGGAGYWTLSLPSGLGLPRAPYFDADENSLLPGTCWSYAPSVVAGGGRFSCYGQVIGGQSWIQILCPSSNANPGLINDVMRNTLPGQTSPHYSAPYISETQHFFPSGADIGTRTGMVRVAGFYELA